MAIITISRKVGSLGDEMADEVAGRLGYRLVGAAEFAALARECDADFSKACQAFETEKSAGFFERLFFRERANLPIFYAMNYDLAAEGDVIIKGRGAQIVFADEPGVLKVRVVAPSELRVARVAERKKMHPEEARDFIRRFDRQRRGLIESVFHRDLADWGLYDLVINTRQMDAETGAEVITTAARRLHQAAAGAVDTEAYRKKAFAKRVEAAVKKRVNTSPYRDVSVEVDSQGVVRLAGFVQDKRSREVAEKVAREAEGVSEVRNELKTTELSF
jgi:cytidylate kinase